MFYMILEINDITYKEDIFLALQSIGISRATSSESRNIGQELTDELTFFTGLFRSDKLKDDEKLMITAQVQTTDQVKELLENLREGGVDIDSQDIITVTVIPAILTFNSVDGFHESDGSEKTDE